MADIQDGEGTDEIALQELGGISAVQTQQSETRTASSQVPPLHRTQDASNSHPLRTSPTESTIQSSNSAPHSQSTSSAGSGTSAREEAPSASPTTSIGPPSRTNSNVAVPPLPTPQNARPSPGAVYGHTKTKNMVSRLIDLKYPMIAIMIVGLTASLMFTTDYQYAPLGSLGASSGILLLNLLGKATDYSLAASADLMWETLQLGPLLKRGEQLLTYLALGSGASFASWMKTLLARRSSDGGTETKRIALWDRPRFWSLIRLLSWAALQFPGLIVLSVANPQTEYYPTNWTHISGGIGTFDSNIAAGKAYSPDLFAGLLTTSILRDTTRTIQVDPISEDCIAAGDSCSSYLIPGGLISISPWPFQQPNGKDIYYITNGEPVYQIDFWTPKDPVVWSADACKLYGTTYFAMKFCMESSTSVEGQILAGWRQCAADVTPSGSCPYRNGSSEASQLKSTAISIYRRAAHITTSRITLSILEVTSLSSPILQKLPPSNFTTVFDAVLLPWTNDNPDFCLTKSAQYSITTTLASNLINPQIAPILPIASDSMRNLFATVIYLFNPTISGVGIQLARNTVSPGLPPENYFNGSLAVGIERIVPARWTAFAYVGVAGLLLGLVLLSQLCTLREDIPETSSFGFVDSLQLKWVTRNAVGDEVEVENFATAFDGVEAGADGEIIRRARDVVVAMGEDGDGGAVVQNGAV